MLSRMAESLYWIGRYVERAEQTARITDVTFSHTLALGSTPEAEAQRRRHWETLLDIVGERAAFPDDAVAADEETVPAHVSFSPDNPNSIVHCIAYARENARTMRHQVATEMWEVLNRFHLDIQRPGRRRRAAASAESATAFCRSVVEFSQLFQGVTDSTMPREEGWCFLQAGKFLERAEKTARALDVNCRLLLASDDPTGGLLSSAELELDPQPWRNLLRALSAYESYFRVSSTSVRPSAVIELLVLSPVVPRSVRFSIAYVDEALVRITDSSHAESEAGREIGRLDAELAYQRLEDLVRHGVQPYLRDVQRRCYHIGERIEDEFFAHRPLTAGQVMG